MVKTPQAFESRLQALRAQLCEQGRRVQTLVEGASECFFARDSGACARVVGLDDEVDRVDVEIERGAVRLLADATHEHARLDAAQLREVLTVVKINNELERIADLGVAVAERVPALSRLACEIPQTFRVMFNSIVGILRDTTRSFERSDPALARVVLQSEDAVEAFKGAILREAEERIASGAVPVEFAFALHEAANQCERIADHCTNMAEQVIYLVTGAIVRHQAGQWVDVPTPPAGPAPAPARP